MNKEELLNRMMQADMDSFIKEVSEEHQIIVGEKYHFGRSSWAIGGYSYTDSYYIVDSWDNITYDMQKQKIDW